MSLSRTDRAGGGGGGGCGLSTSQVDARIASWARTGQDRPATIVKTLPAVANADNDVLYVLEGNGTGWIRKSTVTAIASHRVAHPVSGLDLEGVFSSDLASPNASDFYFNSTTNRFRLWNGSTWADSTIAKLFGANRIGIGIGTGTPAPVETDTIDEVIAYLVENGVLTRLCWNGWTELCSFVAGRSGDSFNSPTSTARGRVDCRRIEMCWADIMLPDAQLWNRGAR